MACSKFEYVKHFEQHSTLLPNSHLVVRVDGHGFHRFTSVHNFTKPNDARGLDLMARAARACMDAYPEITLAYGQSDEFSFVFKRATTLYKRREAKIVSTVASLFTAEYMFRWNDCFPDTKMAYPPSFDARAVCYPTDKNLRDYFSWRQADCHINNLYNTAFWALVQDAKNPRTEREAQVILKDTDSAAKNELLFSSYGINYNALPDMFRKGSVLYRKPSLVAEKSKADPSKEPTLRMRNLVCVEYRDIIGDAFWKENPSVLPPPE
ncbi:tRNAHis guanylyltransferase-domain-containing protein [Fimicolochytrium jonesii]|uniref:tRNAHis guanylyltransferase-domain-containing protein n=1 Tax=Fimicolochytrium jonesii TaxID=1396493 RepID=UPI0022FE79EB|nr:tRNAHis guanylyltransferase-domain-containing protein [Fimicolochytrium jonesii]KAI8821842.1 tRNAHis guanylyltransferase-domain-containing protein [Fimicolochytrium jonesii]